MEQNHLKGPWYVPFPTSSLILVDVLMITDSGSVDTEDVSDELGDTVVTPLHSPLL